VEPLRAPQLDKWADRRKAIKLSQHANRHSWRLANL
jgi:hypothetical protein